MKLLIQLSALLFGVSAALVPYDPCMVTLCKMGTVCRRGKCIGINNCNGILCPSGSYCYNSRCTPDIRVCSDDGKYIATSCGYPRPNDKTCPVVYYIRAPDPQFCGVSADGNRVDFAEECSACKDKNILYYFNKPCQKAPKVLQKDEQCPAKPN